MPRLRDVSHPLLLSIGEEKAQQLAQYEYRVTCSRRERVRLAVVSSACAYLRLPDEAMTKLANRARFRCIRVRCKIEAMISKFSRALSQRCENGLTCSAYPCVYGQLQSRVPLTSLGLLPPILLIPHATRPLLGRSVCLRMDGRNSEERNRQGRRQITIRSTISTQISRNRREKIALSMG